MYQVIEKNESIADEIFSDIYFYCHSFEIFLYYAHNARGVHNCVLRTYIRLVCSCVGASSVLSPSVL